MNKIPPACTCGHCYVCSVARRRKPTPIPICLYEGSIIEAAVCQCANPEMKHIRICLHDDGPDKCVRGSTVDPESVRSCADCKLRSEGSLP